MNGWKKPASDACEDFVFNSYSIITVAGDTAEDNMRHIETYTNIVLAITDVSGSASLPCTLSVVAQFGSSIVYTEVVAEKDDITGVTEIDLVNDRGFTVNPDSNKIFTTSGACRGHIRYKTFVKNEEGRLLKSSYVQFDGPVL